MKTEGYKCDGPNCPHVKGENNHWFLAIKVLGSLTIRPWTSAVSFDHALHLCGESCVQKTVSEFLTSQSRRNGETGRSESVHTDAGDMRPLLAGVVAERGNGGRVRNDSRTEETKIGASQES